MELYNFFSEQICESNNLKYLEIKDIYKDLKETCKGLNIQLIKYNSDGTRYLSVMGQIIGEDTSIGDPYLNELFHTIKFTWFNSFTPLVNNL